MKSCHIVVWWGSISKVKGDLIYSSRSVELPPNPTRGVWKAWSLSRPIFILSNTEVNRMSAKLSLSTKILYTLKLAIVMEPTNATSWGRCKPLKSSLVKVIVWWAFVIGMERLYTSSSARLLASLACLFRDELEDHLDPKLPWMVWILPAIGLLSPHILSGKSGLWAISHIFSQIPLLIRSAICSFNWK